MPAGARLTGNPGDRVAAWAGVRFESEFLHVRRIDAAGRRRIGDPMDGIAAAVDVGVTARPDARAPLLLDPSAQAAAGIRSGLAAATRLRVGFSRSSTRPWGERPLPRARLSRRGPPLPLSGWVAHL
jgi:hypothetical protein